MKTRKLLIISINILLLLSMIFTTFISKEGRMRLVYDNTEAKEMKLAIWSHPNAEKYETDEELEVICQGLKDMGINYVYNEQEWGTYTLNRLMDCYQKYGIKSIIGLPINDEDWAMRIVDGTKNHPACWGYNLKDEPATQEFDHLRKMAGVIRSEIPKDKQVTTNMLPNVAFTWGGIENISFVAYTDYLQQYIRKTEIDTLSFDHYPLGSQYGVGTEEMVCYLKNLLDFNIQCRNSETEATSIIQSGSWDDRRMPTSTELKFLVSLNLVSGMDGITYFLYWTNIGEGGKVALQGLMHYDGTPHPLYYTAKEINEGLSKMKGVFLDYDQHGYIFTNPPKEYWDFEKSVTCENVILESFGPVRSVVSSGPVLSGCFENADGKKALYVMNFNMSAASGQTRDVYLDFLTNNTEYKVWDYTGLSKMDKGHQLKLELEPGEAAFVEFD